MPKYIVVPGPMGTEMGIPFSEIESHANMAKHFGGKEKVLGAGEFSIYCDSDNQFNLCCFGESSTLEKKSRGRIDAIALKWSLFCSSDNVKLQK